MNETFILETDKKGHELVSSTLLRKPVGVQPQVHPEERIKALNATNQRLKHAIHLIHTSDEATQSIKDIALEALTPRK